MLGMVFWISRRQLPSTVLSWRHQNILFSTEVPQVIQNRTLSSISPQSYAKNHCPLLSVPNLTTVQAMMYKTKAREALKKRCFDCYFKVRHGRYFVECRKHPRHKQMEFIENSKKRNHQFYLDRDNRFIR